MKTLIEQLQQYRPTDTRDAHAKQAMIDLAMAHPQDKHHRHFHTPGHFTCSGIIINPEGTHVLSNLHGKCDVWMHFGGHWETWSNTALMTILHEIAEEVFNLPEQHDLPDMTPYQLEMPLGEDFFDVSVGNVIRTTEPLHKHFDIRFLLTLPLDCLVRISKESKDMRWMTFEEAHSLWTQDSNIDVHRLLLKAQRWAQENIHCHSAASPGY